MKMQQGVYVPAVAPDTPVVLKHEPTRQGVIAGAAANFLGGIGAGAVVVTLWCMLWGILYQWGTVTQPWPDPVQLLIGAGLVTLFVFGALSFARNALDELLETMDWNATLARLDAANTRADDCEDDCTELRRLLAIAENRADVAELHLAQGKPDKYTPATVALGPEWNDAKALILRKFSGQSWARDSLVVPSDPNSWKQQQWIDAMSVLTRAGIAIKPGKAWRLWDERATLDDTMAVLDEQREAAMQQLERNNPVRG